MVVSVSGFGWSGSGAVLDLLREYSDIQIAFDRFNRSVEFLLLADVDGIRDLEYHLVERPSRISSYLAIQRYLNLVRSFSHYMNLDAIGLLDITEAYLKQLVDFNLTGSTYHESFEIRPFYTLYNRSVRLILGNRISRCFIGENTWKRFLYENKIRMSVSYSPEDFLQKTKAYLNSIFTVLSTDDNKPLVFDQMLPADNPTFFMKYFDDARCIAVRRDPRDTYVLAKKVYHSSIPIPVDSVEDFVLFYKKIVQDTIISDNPKVLNLQFEDLIYSYEVTKARIEDFLGITQHYHPRSLFNPTISANNTQLYKKYTGLEKDIKIIEESLPASLYQFEAKPQISSINSVVF